MPPAAETLQTRGTVRGRRVAVAKCQDYTDHQVATGRCTLATSFATVGVIANGRRRRADICGEWARRALTTTPRKHQPHSRVSRAWQDQRCVHGAVSASRTMTSRGVSHACGRVAAASPWRLCKGSSCFSHRRLLAALPSSPCGRAHTPCSNAVVLQRRGAGMSYPLKVCAVCGLYGGGGDDVTFEFWFRRLHHVVGPLRSEAA